MNILILGSGGREHALAWAVKQNPKCDRLIVAPGNAGIAMLAECADIDILDGAAVRIIPEVFAARKFLCPGGHQNQEQGHQQRTPFLHSASPFDSVF